MLQIFSVFYSKTNVSVPNKFKKSNISNSLTNKVQEKMCFFDQIMQPLCNLCVFGVNLIGYIGLSNFQRYWSNE